MQDNTPPTDAGPDLGPAGAGSGAKKAEVPPPGGDPLPDPITDLEQRRREAGVTDQLPFGPLGRPLGRFHPFSLGFSGALGVIIALLLFEAIRNAGHVLLLIIVAMFLAVGLNPAVERLVRLGLSRGKSVALVFLGVLLLFTGFGWALVPPIVTEISRFAEEIPTYIAQLQGNRKIAEWDAKYKLLEKAQQTISESGFQKSVADWALSVGKGTLSAIFNTFTVLILMLYFLAGLPQIKMFFYRFTPRSRRARVALLGDEILDQIGNYVGGIFTVATISGISAYLFLSIVGVPYAAALALIVALTGLIPMVGATIGGVLVTVVGFLTGVPEGIACAVFFVLYQQVENYVISPRIMERSVSVQPIVTIIAALLGGALMGVVGALLAIPTAAAIALIIREVILPRQDAR